MNIFVASSNLGKLREFADAAVSYELHVYPLKGLGGIDTPHESGSTFAENAAIKAIAYSRHAPGEIVIADDSGLEVDALGGAPGILSARYAQQGERTPSDADNNYKLLYELSQKPQIERTARFICVIAAADRKSVV